MSRTDDRYRREYRVTSARLWYPTVAYTIAAAALLLRMNAQGAAGFITIPVAVFFAALLVWMFLALRGGATIVDERGVLIQRPRLFGGDLAWDWPDIQGIEIQVNPAVGQRAAPRLLVLVYVAGGKRYLLPHVHDRSGLDVPQEVATLRSLWTLGRGEDWQPDPETAAKIAYKRKHPLTLGIVGLLGAIAGFVLGIVVFFIVLISGGYADGGPPEASPGVLLGVLPVAACVVTVLIVGLRRRAERERG